MPGIAVLVPVLGRPQNVAPLIQAFTDATPQPHRLLFICDPGDRAEQDAIARAGGQMISPGGTYAEKIREGVRATDEPYLLFGADDIKPHPGWFTAALATGAPVVGLNDLIDRPQRPEHATHFLVTREAAEMSCLDHSPGPLFLGYGHWRVDDEFIATATKRGMYAYAPDAIVEHFHPIAGSAPDDETYRKGRATARRDNRLFRHRTKLWT